MLDVSPYLLDLVSLQPPVDWKAIFGNDHPIELEVGSGKGLFLANAAAREPEHNFFGIELSRKYARKTAERVAKTGLSNVRVLMGDARLFLNRFVPPRSLRAVHIYFPDPWWKTRHKKRRVFTGLFVEDVERALEPAGVFWMATDVVDYYQVMRTLLAGHRAFQEEPMAEPAHNLDYLTNFERKYRLEGRPIFRAHYRLRPADDAGTSSPGP
jgi:tRNA (guanine-N7-)-methyltransferase